MKSQYDTKTKRLTLYRIICDPIATSAGISLVTVGVVDNFDPVKIVVGTLIYFMANGASQFMQNRIYSDRFKGLEDKLNKK